MANRKDFAVSTVTTPPDSATAGTSMTLGVGHVPRFPTAPFYATVAPDGERATLDNAEKILVTDTDEADDSITFTRAQGDTTAKPIGVGWVVFAGAFVEDLTPDNIEALALAGGTMSGNINMSGNSIGDSAGDLTLNSTVAVTGDLKSGSTVAADATIKETMARVDNHWWQRLFNTNASGDSQVMRYSSDGGTAWQNALELLANGTAKLFGNLNMNSNKAINLSDPTAAQDAATKAYVDSTVASSAGFSNAGAWTDGTAYNVNDFVRHNGGVWICILAHTSVEADDEPGVGTTNGTKWELYVENPVLRATVPFSAPESGDNRPAFIAPALITIQRVIAYTQGGTSPEVDIQITGGGSDLWAADQTIDSATPDELSTTFADSAVAKDEAVEIDVSSVTGSPDAVIVQIEYTED